MNRGTAAAPDGNGPSGKGFELQSFTPAYGGDRFFGVNDASTDQTNFAAELIADYAAHELKVINGNNSGYLMKSQFYGNLDLTVGFAKHFLINADVPLAIAQSGDANAGGLGNDSPKGSKLGDVRVGGRINFFGSYESPFAMGVQGDVWLPTGDKDNLTGDQKPRVNPKLLLGGHAEGFTYALNAGYLFRHDVYLGGPSALGQSVTFGAAAGLSLLDNAIQIGPELYGQTMVGSDSSQTVNTAAGPVGPGTPKFLGTHTTEAELLGGMKFTIADKVQLGAAGGGGLTKGPGTPSARALVTLAYIDRTPPGPGDRDGDGISDDQDACPDTPGVASPDPRLNGCPAQAPADRDGDGVPDNVDACPDTPGVANNDPAKNGCPADRDGDGIPDNVDACPDTPGVASQDPKKNGCPADRDGDGIGDNEDACPDVPGVRSSDPKKNGCPADRDGDGIPDAQDACPDQPGVKTNDPKTNGCPPPAMIKGGRIVISEQVHFQTGKTTILPDSDKILQAVAEILTQHAEITLVSIEGHTDNVGAKGFNMQLSKGRAASVKKWLTTKGGIPAARLTTSGYGDSKPIASNDTDEGRAQNRRVELHIVRSSDPNMETSPGNAPIKLNKPKPLEGSATRQVRRH